MWLVSLTCINVNVSGDYAYFLTVSGRMVTKTHRYTCTCCSISAQYQDMDALGQDIIDGGGSYSDVSCGDSDNDGLPDRWEWDNFGHLGVDPNADPDGDGLSNLQECQNNTDPLVADPPAILTQPQSQTVMAGTNATFSVTPTGVVLASYGFQWQFNGTNIGGATGTSLTLTNVQSAQAGNYWVVVSNVAGSVTSSNASLTVIVMPTNISNLLMWLKTDAGVRTNVYGIFQWNDQSGNGNNAYQNPGNTEPFYTNNGLSGNPAIYFPGANYFSLPNNMFTGVTQAEAFVVLQVAYTMPTNYHSLWYSRFGWKQLLSGRRLRHV